MARTRTHHHHQIYLRRCQVQRGFVRFLSGPDRHNTTQHNTEHPLVDLSLPVEAEKVVGEGLAVHQALEGAVHEAGVSKILKAYFFFFPKGPERHSSAEEKATSSANHEKAGTSR